MFETAEIGQQLSKEEFKEREPSLRESLLTAQRRLRETAWFPVIVLFAGVDGAGKSETVNLLNEWMDPRWIVTRAFAPPSEEERERPEYWRYWRDLPPKGRIGLFLSAWYSNPLLRHVYGQAVAAELDEKLDEILAFERTLADDGALILKFWMHLGRKEQKRRLEALEKDPLQSWRITKRDWKNWRLYNKFMEGAERIISATSTARAPWTIVEGVDHHYRSLRVGEVLLQAMETEIEKHSESQRPFSSPSASTSLTPRVSVTTRTVLSTLDMPRDVEEDAYDQILAKYQGKLNRLQREARDKKLSTILLFEGWDAAGKGGAIRRITAALDARDCQVIPIAAPTDEERAQHYLWRFWRHLPRAGRVTIFDRSWYGRVLVERVDGLATEEEWRRAYSEIRLFERQMVEHGFLLLKFWLHITKDEQLKRFKLREETPFKRWKISQEDWHNREKWDQYETAVHDMVERTSTEFAPWILVEANDKRYARVKVLRSICDRLKEATA